MYGSAYAKLVPAVAVLHPDLMAWMLEEGYGRVLSRPGLSGRERERITVAVLAACGWRRQLVSHLVGAVRLGVARAQVRSAFVAGLAHCRSCGASGLPGRVAGGVPTAGGSSRVRAKIAPVISTLRLARPLRLPCSR